MTANVNTACTAFEGFNRIASGPLGEVVAAAKIAHDLGSTAPILFFDDSTSEQIEVDLRGSQADVAHRLPHADVEDVAPAAAHSAAPQAIPRGPGRPRLGVVAREVTLLPRHWEWLSTQTGGASVALRKLVDEAKRGHETRDRTRAAQESAYRFMSVMAGNQRGFEEATRALFASNQDRFEQIAQYWPSDVRDHATVLASRAFGATRFKNV